MMTTYPTFALDPNHLVSARAALLLLALPDDPGNVERLRQEAEVALRRTYGDLDRAGVTRGELRRASICSSLRRMNMRELQDAASRLDD